MGKRVILSNQTRGLRIINVIPVTADNQQFTIDIPRGPAVESVLLRFSGTFAITTAFTAVRSSAAYRLLKQANFVLNSNVTMDSVSGTQLAQLYVTMRSYPSLVNPSGVAIAPGMTFDATFIFDRALMDMVRPKDSMLKTDIGVANLQLRVQLGALADMFTGAGVATYTSCSLSASVIDYQEAKDPNGNTPDPTFYVKRNGQQESVSGVVQGRQIKLNTGNRLRIVSMIVRDPTTLEPNLALVSRFGLKRAGDQRVDVPTTELLRLNQRAYSSGSGVLLPGQVLWDFANVGYLIGAKYSEFWPIPSSADTFLVVDTTGAALLDIATLEGVDLAS
jgi:hypothetical protein